ncbi:AcrG protein [Aeromonas encheleia]|jgi:type III secretion system LcrG-like protein|uniref:LcrG family type III secretion system chaperone n=1 Tax=Aeromonas TaxID=642 RepID=UPI0005B20F38|nr:MULTISPECIES: LcrG family type III secretion system chaperone [Aeromonas]MBV7598745.1 LcrG family type III secretion system chaperone [Aeromonas sp. sia0103]UNP89607.1 LcrG family type III secretion system chaperone [Aeromonas encheleia]VEG97272.1 AcrG protein [Aeromonas encheleia]
MKEHQGSEHDEAIAKAELAIRDSDHRTALLNEMWNALDISPQVTSLLFAEGSVSEKSQAEQELLGELYRRRQLSPPETNNGVRPRRPAMMRGLVI